MAHQVLHGTGSTWGSSDPARLAISDGTPHPLLPGVPVHRLIATDTAAGVSGDFTPATPLDLTPYDELRLWVRADRAANQREQTPFYLAFAFTDANDAPDETHEWVLPVNRADRWEQRRIGIADERRSEVERLNLMCLTNIPFRCDVCLLLAVREEPLIDVEQALAARLAGLALPDLTGLPLQQGAGATATDVLVAARDGITANTHIAIDDGVTTSEHIVTAVTEEGDNLRLSLDSQVGRSLSAGGGTVMVRVPVVPHGTAATPAIAYRHIGTANDPQRTQYRTQRDSFQLIDDSVISSTRPGAQAITVDYELTPVTAVRHHALALHVHLVRLLSLDSPLLVNGYPSPVYQLPPPDADEGDIVAPVSVRVGTRIEVAPRRQTAPVRVSRVIVAHRDQPETGEEIEF